MCKCTPGKKTPFCGALGCEWPTRVQADEYYMQDTRSHVGNSMMWWARGGQGYTCDIRKAMVFSREAAEGRHRMRSTDRPWPKPYVDARISHHIDFQHCDYGQCFEADAGVKHD